MDEKNSSCDPSAAVRSKVLSHNCKNSLGASAYEAKPLEAFFVVEGGRPCVCIPIEDEEEEDDDLFARVRIC